jgi:hypothetical protein
MADGPDRTTPWHEQTSHEVGPDTRPGAFPGDVLEPTRDLRATLPDLVDALLDKGVYLDLDLIVTVADIPLIGVNLRATVAGIETMLEHGMMRRWDAETREWVRRSVTRHVPLADDEDVVARMAGGHRQEEPAGLWRPGTVYLTTRRLLVWRADPSELLWQADLDDVVGVGLRVEPTVGGEERTRVLVETRAGTALLTAAAPEHLRDLLLAHGARPAAGPSPDAAPPLLRAHAWYLERLADRSTWRGGTATLDATAGLTWQGPLDGRPAVRLRPERITAVDVVRGRTPTGARVVVVHGRAGAGAVPVVRLAVADAAAWARAVADVAGLRALEPAGGAR